MDFQTSGPGVCPAMPAVVFRANHDTVGVLEVGDRRTFAQKIRVGRDRDILRTFFLEDLDDLVARPHWNR